ncbi:MAG: class I SAM-dependent methyltransferase [Phycisphaerae bacterium]|nr:class I SAM-dependent methyltransferase [Phycisphaerae bacterium]
MKLSLSSQLLTRNLDELAGENILIVNSPDGEIGPGFAERHPQARITLVQTEYSDYRQAEQQVGGTGKSRIEVRFCAWYASPAQAHDLAIVYLPKSRAMLDLILDMVAGALAKPARVLLVGPVRGGIKSSKSALERCFGAATKLDVARHCVLYSTTVTEPPAHESRLEDWGTTCTFDIAGQALEVFSYPGVFSHGRLDDGTRLLLETLDSTGGDAGPAIKRSGGSIRVLDFGCGCGVIGAWIHARQPRARIEMVDSHALAVEAARKTAALNSLPDECVYPSDVFSDVRHRYGLIISNPPFHAGIKTDYLVVERFFEGVAARLAHGGKLRLVANRFHKYKPLIQQYVGRCQTVAENSRYRVYEAVAFSGRAG